MKILIKKIIKRIVLIALFIYVVSIFISQQKMLNSCAAEKSQYTNEIETAKAEQDKLNSQLNNVNSTNYIEEMARDNIDMYLPNERVYIDITK